MNRLVEAATGVAARLAGRQVAEGFDFVIEREHTRIDSLRTPLRVVLLTDLHYGPYVRRASVGRWVDAARAERPDLLLIGGDLVDRFAGEVTGLLAELGRLRAPLGTYAVWGNHDHARYGAVASFGADLARAGVEVLTNRGAPLRDDLFLAGMDDLRRGEPRLADALRGRPDGSACLLLSHNPDVLPEVPAEVDLTLCGHTHGGQVRLPGVGAVFTSSHYRRRFLAGWVRGPALGYVSRGLGVSMLPVRLDCPAELTVLDLTP
jgi:uncharacterized protein